jgi:hypothetical protein
MQDDRVRHAVVKNDLQGGVSAIHPGSVLDVSQPLLLSYMSICLFVLPHDMQVFLQLVCIISIQQTRLACPTLDSALWNGSHSLNDVRPIGKEKICVIPDSLYEYLVYRVAVMTDSCSNSMSDH